MKIRFTAKFPLLPLHSFCMEVSQLSPPVLLSEKMQEGLSYVINKKKREEKNPNKLIFLQPKLHWCIRNSLVPQISETFKMGEALYFCLFFGSCGTGSRIKLFNGDLLIMRDFSATWENRGGWTDFKTGAQYQQWKYKKVILFFFFILCLCSAE